MIIYRTLQYFVYIHILMWSVALLFSNINRLVDELSPGQLEVLEDVLHTQLRRVVEARIDRVRRTERENLLSSL